jgi:DNA (cytosine-5)-methyltransferase 1
MANTLDTGCQQGVVEQENNVRYRIRKLSPRECFRLMGVDDADIDKIQESGISNSQQYKMAGNSIVVDTLYHLFRKMFIDTGCEREGHQQTLF